MGYSQTNGDFYFLMQYQRIGSVLFFPGAGTGYPLCLYNVLRNKVVTAVSNTDTQFHSAADGFHVFAII